MSEVFVMHYTVLNNVFITSCETYYENLTHRG